MRSTNRARWFIGVGHRPRRSKPRSGKTKDVRRRAANDELTLNKVNHPNELTMQRQRTTWCYLAVLALLASCGLGAFAAEGTDKKDEPKPLRPEIVKAWRDAGAEVGWMKRDEFGWGQFRESKIVETGAIPAFGFLMEEAKAVKLPDPGLAFGLDLCGSPVSDTGLKELVGLSSLQSLNLTLLRKRDGYGAWWSWLA